MLKILKFSLIIFFTFILVLSCTSCTSTTGTPAATAPKSRVVPVQRGNLAVTVSVDGSLVMPQAFDLRFGAPGDVQDVLVKEGDFVRAGTIMAMLDSTAQRLDIKSANNSVQNVLSNLYETVPRLPKFPTNYYQAISSVPIVTPSLTQDTVIMWNNNNPPPPPIGIVVTPINTATSSTNGLTTTVTTTVGSRTVTAAGGTIPGTTEVTTNVNVINTTISTTLTAPEGVHNDISYPNYYPNGTTSTSYGWAQDEVAAARDLFLAENYTAAASELYVALSDLESCLKIIEDAVNNPESGLGNTAPFVPTDLPGLVYFEVQQDQPAAVTLIVELRKAIDSIKQGQADIEKLRGLVAQGKPAEAGPLFEEILSRVDDIGRVVVNNINFIKTRNDTDIYGRDISFYFYAAAEGKINAALKGVETGGLGSPDLNSNLRIARHYIELCNAILGTNDYVLQHGLSLKAEQGYKVDLENALVTLGNREKDFLNTVIMAPFDGTVVSVAVKKNDVLSAQDYSSKGTIQLVDTTQIKFQGLVDEIDILKIKTGQRAAISVDAVPGKTFTGRVSFISPYGSKGTGSVVKFAVTIQLDAADAALKGGLTSTADVTVSNIENVLLVPLTAITTTATGSFVNIMESATGKAEKRQVTLGGQNQQFAEIVKGLKEGDKIVIEEKVVKAPVITTPGGPPGGGGPPPR